MVEKYNVILRKLLQQSISEPEFYDDLPYKIRKIVGKSNFSEQFRKLINRYKRIGYNPYFMRQTACLVINPTSVDSYASLFNCTTAGRPQTQWRPRHKTFTSGLGLDAMYLAWPTGVQLVVSFNSGLQWGISQEYTFFVSSKWSIWFYVFTEMHWVRKPLCEPNFLCIFCIKNYIGTQGEACTVKGLYPPPLPSHPR